MPFIQLSVFDPAVQCIMLPKAGNYMYLKVFFLNKEGISTAVCVDCLSQARNGNVSLLYKYMPPLI